MGHEHELSFIMQGFPTMIRCSQGGERLPGEGCPMESHRKRPCGMPSCERPRGRHRDRTETVCCRASLRGSIPQPRCPQLATWLVVFGCGTWDQDWLASYIDAPALHGPACPRQWVSEAMGQLGDFSQPSPLKGNSPRNSK